MESRVAKQKMQALKPMETGLKTSASSICQVQTIVARHLCRPKPLRLVGVALPLLSYSTSCKQKEAASTHVQLKWASNLHL